MVAGQDGQPDSSAMPLADSDMPAADWGGARMAGPGRMPSAQGRPT